MSISTKGFHEADHAKGANKPEEVCTCKRVLLSFAAAVAVLAKLPL